MAARLGKMPVWQRYFVISSICLCSMTGLIFLLVTDYQLHVFAFRPHTILSWHGVTAMAASIALGSVLTFHLKAGLKAKRQLFSGLSQLACLIILILTAALLYYGPADLRDHAITVHWVIGIIFFGCFLSHGFHTSSKQKALN
ncbi:hypothetical protein G6652_09100 [Polynucleobacter paneuropaeus]|jgi:O-antigen/teichoic acid export membrane protein|nr:hypothetical protein [Polynucleobacter paneuropaeus]MBT8568223.1 hypothetical protein [Polynucleobacter paneuropaeus]MBT8577535.1 hypothetical protein [Polynucleobacter paneuropaeus]MBT8615503.1 hypothetical protein [Polynucleobacter paneuropaeus]MBT8617381.1 hypothetical protein [Polynucleobacter paneuropaeus]